ncbi:MAG: DNA primase [Nanoarchaeota archaeon]|nr:DNA primase [Nanoarchaeota archaeon]MBU1445455.1 DNA primase [Nanoarchaeota archaeon]MBU2420263.1 DNA primase [Nanoarchaeota archaeon]MBU2474974.1 DNA primase [Nanoarchaeota archaeon]MBU3940725.1 DNA primase [Nanoarchaeota archaeon]
MGKISQVSAKYIIHAQIQIDGVVDRPDVIGAIFGQTEGLLGSELELRELQRNGKIGRIEVKLEVKAGKSDGEIIIPSSLDKTETAIIAASLETIQRIGPCNAKVKADGIEDVRISKRNYVIERAKELLKDLTEKVLPDSQEITDEVAYSVRMMEIKEYGKERLAAGPAIDDSDDIIIVEGRADVLNLLKHGIKNAIAVGGTSIPETVKELTKSKVVTAFVDGDRGGDLIIRELMQVGEIDFVTKAPDGKEVEELTKKEINIALRAKVAAEQARFDSNGHKEPIRTTTTPSKTPTPTRAPVRSVTPTRVPSRTVPDRRTTTRPPIRTSSGPRIPQKEKDTFKSMLDDLVGTRGAYILDQDTNVLGKVPTSELATTIKSLNSVHAIIFDGSIDRDLIKIAEKAGLKYLVAMDSTIPPSSTKVIILTKKDFN